MAYRRYLLTVIKEGFIYQWLKTDILPQEDYFIDTPLLVLLQPGNVCIAVISLIPLYVLRIRGGGGAAALKYYRHLSGAPPFLNFQPTVVHRAQNFIIFQTTILDTPRN